MSSRSYRLTVTTSPRSATAFCLSAACDDDAVGQALTVLKKISAFCERPSCEMVRDDGSLVRGLMPMGGMLGLAAA